MTNHKTLRWRGDGAFEAKKKKKKNKTGEWQRARWYKAMLEKSGGDRSIGSFSPY